jgi:hypothetical protein
MVNIFFYKFLLNLTTLNKSFEEDDTLVNLKDKEFTCILTEICNLYKLKKDVNNPGKFCKGRLLAFFLKTKSVELHEVICGICANLTKNKEACIFFCNDQYHILNDLVEFFFSLNREYLNYFLNKNKDQKNEKVPLIISIIDNTLLTFDNIITRNNKSSLYFMNLLLLKSITKNKIINHIGELIENTTELLKFTNNKMKKTAEDFVNNLNS